jgi:hypothetical protein
VWSDSQGDFASSGADQLPIRAAGGVSIGTNAPETQLHVAKDTTQLDGTFLDAYVTLVENTNTAVSADGLAIKIGTPGNPNHTSNFVGFFDGDTGLIGQIEGNGSGGVTYLTSGADYAEMLPQTDPAATIVAGDVVGVHAGRISHKTDGANAVLVVTDRPAVVGNMPAGQDHIEGHAAVSFAGQVPVKVVGQVQAGDYLVASDREDGTAVAVAPSELDVEDIERVIGRAWESSSASGTKRMNAAVGLDRGQLTASILSRQRATIDGLAQATQERTRRLEQEVERLNQQNGAIQPFDRT